MKKNSSQQVMGSAFLEGLAAYSFFSFLTEGPGAVMLKSPERVREEDEGLICYLAMEEASHELSARAFRLIAGYNAEREMVLIRERPDGSRATELLSVDELNLTPGAAYRTWSFGQGFGPFVEGDVVQLDQAVPGMPPGTYIYLGSENAWRKFCRAEIRPGGRYRRTRTIAWIHIDFDELFAPVSSAVAPQVRPGR